jgi:transcriptional regulator with XRE-family HTH domain
MEHIGQRIKDLRKKADLTQDRLADYLGVSPQAVSKWEVGSASPDLALIAPLCRVLGCTSDELLGIRTGDEDSREHELYMMASGNDGNPDRFDTRLHLQKCLAAVEEYPRNLWLHYYCAMNEMMLPDDPSPAEGQAKTRREHVEAAEKRYRFILEEAKDDSLRACVYNNLVLMLVEQGRKEEAEELARSCPTHGKLSADFLLLYCLEGEEGERHWQWYVKGKLLDLLLALSRRRENLAALEAIEGILRVMLPDGNYLGFYNNLYLSLEKQAELLTRAGRYDEAVNKLAETCETCRRLDAVNSRVGETLPYTAPLFDLLDSTMPFLSMANTATRDAVYWLRHPCFDPLREREDFRALVAELERGEKAETGEA